MKWLELEIKQLWQLSITGSVSLPVLFCQYKLVEVKYKVVPVLG
jgi:hypothetical protein